MLSSDKLFVERNRDRYQRALNAAVIHLYKDSRFLGAPNLRVDVAELAALQAVTGEERSIGKKRLEHMSTENVNLYLHGLAGATTAAKLAIGAP